MDVDFDVKDPSYEQKMAAVPELVLSKKDELGLLMLERSVRKGYHIVFKRRPELSQEENLRWASELLGVQYDEGAKDITRVFFTTTSDPNDLIFLDAELFVNEELGVRSEELTPTLRENNNDQQTNNSSLLTPHSSLNYQGIAYDLIISKYWELFNDGKEPAAGNRNPLSWPWH